jgi:carbon monoxide dehydrogenase subunit G
MTRKVQGSNELVIDASAEQIWEILIDPARVPEYMAAVKRIEGEPRESVGAVRTCHVEMQGRSGEVVERCDELEEHRRLTHVMERDGFGFSRMFEDFGFSFVLEPLPGGRANVRIEGFYRERNPMTWMLNRLVMRRKLHRLRAGILAGLKAVAERRSVSARAGV